MKFLLFHILFTLARGAMGINCGYQVCAPGGPYCTYTDAWRQFNTTCTLGSLVNADDKTVTLYTYDWHCIEIGYNPSVAIGKTFDFYSQLKWVIVINFNASDYPPSFMYAGKHYGQNATKTFLPDPNCYNSGGYMACETQFDC